MLKSFESRARIALQTAYAYLYWRIRLRFKQKSIKMELKVIDPIIGSANDTYRRLKRLQTKNLIVERCPTKLYIPPLPRLRDGGLKKLIAIELTILPLVRLKFTSL